MFREPDIREEISGLIDVLVEMYHETDPSKGEESEYGKLEIARQAIEKFWYLFGRLLLWAQCHITGYCIARDNPKVVQILKEEFGIEVTEDSHLLEVLGLLYPYNPVDREEPLLKKMVDRFEHETEVFSWGAMRTLVMELLMARCANSSYWRFDVQEGLRSLNEGQVERIFKPSKSRLRGQPASLNRWKLEALRQVYYRVGKGLKKHRALREIGDGIGQSPETLRDWEKDILKSEDRQNDLYCSQLAGEFDQFFGDGGHPSSIPDDAEYGIHRGVRNSWNAKYLHERIRTVTLQEIKDKIRQFRDPRSSEVE